MFDRLTSSKTLEGEEENEESELKYLQVIREIREGSPDLFEKIKHLPKKARTAKRNAEFDRSLITYFCRGKLQKFFVSRDKEEARELDFMAAAKLLESTPDEKKKDIPRDFYDLLDKNKTAFVAATTDEVVKPQSRGRDNSTKIIQVLKATLHSTQRFTEDQEAYIARIITQLAEGGLPKQTIKNT